MICAKPAQIILHVIFVKIQILEIQIIYANVKLIILNRIIAVYYNVLVIIFSLINI